MHEELFKPMPVASVTVDAKVSKTALKKICRIGQTRLFEQRWYIVRNEDTLSCYLAASGVCLFQAAVENEAITAVCINRDPGQYRQSLASAEQQLRTLIKELGAKEEAASTARAPGRFAVKPDKDAADKAATISQLNTLIRES